MMYNKSIIPIIIPSYEPDDRLIDLLKELRDKKMEPVILVDDGSGDKYREVFSCAERIIEKNDGVLLSHEINKGKGRALKTAFEYVINNVDGIIGVVTADSDGQHTPDCIERIRTMLSGFPDELILGVRKFSGKNIPWKSRFGNSITEFVFKYISGVHISDTQTGLRGIPASFIKELMSTPGERFEFEMRMLLDAAGKYNIREVEIETIYDSVDNHQTHFNPLKDSIKIYRILGARFFRFMISSLSSSLIDLALFTALCLLLKKEFNDLYVIYATIGARIVSVTYNYIVNYKIVFNSSENIVKSIFKYIGLAVLQMTLSAILVFAFVKGFNIIPETVHKILVDTFLFLVSFKIQQKFVFGKGNTYG